MNKRLKDDLQIGAMAAALFGFAVYLIMLRLNRQLWWLCFVAAAGLFAIIAAYLVGYSRFVTRRYADAMAATGYTARFQTQGNFLTELGKRTGFIYFCDDRIILISLDKRPHMTIQIPASEAVSYTMPRSVQINVQMKDGSQRTIHTAEAGMLGALMHKKRWKKG